MEKGLEARQKKPNGEKLLFWQRISYLGLEAINTLIIGVNRNFYSMVEVVTPIIPPITRPFSKFFYRLLNTNLLLTKVKLKKKKERCGLINNPLVLLVLDIIAFLTVGTGR